MKMNFDAEQVAPRASSEPIPAGWYTLIADKCESKVAKSGNGEYLEIEWKVYGGPHDGRRIWSRLNLWNSNKTAVEIAERDLSGICHALRIAKLGDSDELINRPLEAKVGIEKNAEYGDRNDIREYRAAGSKPAPVAAAASGNSPWAN